MTLLHVSLTASDAAALAKFYREVFGYADRRPVRRLSGEAVSRGNGLPNSDILSIWLELPGDHGPFLEIMQYDPPVSRAEPAVNEPGFAHLAFAVPDLDMAVSRVLAGGGKKQGEITNLGTDDTPFRVIYVRDPEGNILELEERAFT